ncbi:MAG: hypothetical protein GWP61_16745 [Chloroflexi bacterium]|jgi:uncharacterized protein YkwD|nr:hypothetical protein [Chloroflexota bacterium]
MWIRSWRSFVFLLIGCLVLVVAVSCRDGAEQDALREQEIAAAVAATVAASGVKVEQVENEPPTAVATEPAPATATEMPTATATAMPSPSPTATATPAPTDTPLPTPTETAVPVPLPEWLSYLNRFRAMANLPPLADRESYSQGSKLHSRYMVGNDDPIAHREERNKLYFDEAGDLAARNGNLFATSQKEANYMWSINFWISGPFHLLGLLNPNLEVVGYGDYVEETGDVRMAGVLDIKSHPEGTVEGIEYPIMFPGDGTETWVVRHALFEWPFPLDGCPGYTVPVGAPIILMLGDGSITPNVTSHRLARGDEPLESCLFDETSFRNNIPSAQELGRGILDRRDAVVIMPRKPLPINETYTVQVTVNGETHTWSFKTRKGPN